MDYYEVLDLQAADDNGGGGGGGDEGGGTGEVRALSKVGLYAS